MRGKRKTQEDFMVRTQLEFFNYERSWRIEEDFMLRTRLDQVELKKNLS